MCFSENATISSPLPYITVGQVRQIQQIVRDEVREQLARKDNPVPPAEPISLALSVSERKALHDHLRAHIEALHRQVRWCPSELVSVLDKLR